jgi:hypothetical protein
MRVFLAASRPSADAPEAEGDARNEKATGELGSGLGAQEERAVNSGMRCSTDSL